MVGFAFTFGKVPRVSFDRQWAGAPQSHTGNSGLNWNWQSFSQLQGILAGQFHPQLFFATIGPEQAQDEQHVDDILSKLLGIVTKLLHVYSLNALACEIVACLIHTNFPRNVELVVGRLLLGYGRSDDINPPAGALLTLFSSLQV